MKKGLLMLSMLVAISILLAACGGAAGSNTIKVGGIGELTGDIPAVGASFKNAAEMAVQEVRLDGVEVEPSAGFIHERRQTRRRIVSAALADPLDRLFQTDFQLYVHSGPSPGKRASAGLRAVFHRKYSRSNPSGQDHRTHRTLPDLAGSGFGW